MKLMTLNTHSLIEKDYQHKLSDFVSAVCEINPDIIALQEVNQSVSEKKADVGISDGYYPCDENINVNKDNHVYNAVRLLRKKGLQYYWTWLPLKKGYDIYTEGIAVMSSSPIIEARAFCVSDTDNFDDWKTRKIIGIRNSAVSDEWFFSVHYGWWNDSGEPFENQWKNTLRQLPHARKIWLMGDFNNPSDVRSEGYDMITSDGWYDSYEEAQKKDCGITVGKVIDGWREKIISTDGMRIDYILSSKKADILSSEVVFNGRNFPVVSDHYGVVIDYKRSLV